MQKNKRLKVAKMILKKNKEEKAPDKNYLESDYNKNIWCQCRSGQRDQWN